MTAPLQVLNRRQIRQSIGYNLADMVLVTASTTGDTSSLIATYSLFKGGDDEYNGRQLYMATPVGSIAAGEKSWVSDFDSTLKDATVSPVFSAVVGNGDVFELWRVFTVEEINDAINQAINDITQRGLQIKETHTAFSEDDKYEYDVLSGFTHITKLEYVYSVGTEKVIHACNAVWNELVDADVTASLDTTFKKEGSGSLKLVVAAGAAAADILATEDITSLDLSECTEVQIWIWSSVALSAGDIQLLLDNTASCASPVESLNIPAVSANTWTRLIISLANPYNDSAIISVGLKMVVDKGAFTLRADDIKAIDAYSNVYRPVPSEHWGIAKGSTPLLQLTSNGLSMVGSNRQMRLTGLQIAALLNADTTNSEIDPAWLIAEVTGRLLISHAKSSRLDIHDRAELSRYWLAEAKSREAMLTAALPGGSRMVS